MYEDRVAKGAALLDRVRPGWEREIVADRLAMQSCELCVFGQLYGDYASGVNMLDDMTSEDPSDYGFDIPDRVLGFGESSRVYVLGFGESSHAYEALADAWRAEVRRRVVS